MRRKFLAILSGVLLVLVSVIPVNASTGVWSDPGYQWRTSKPFSVSIIDYTTTQVWHDRVALAAAQWSQASAVDVIVGGKGKFKVGVVNFYNPGAGCAWTQADINGGYLKAPVTIYLNDECIDRGIIVWGDRFDYGQLVICNEMGHGIGLPDHRVDDPGVPDCMAPGIHPGPSPIQDDFDKIAELYKG